MTGVGLARSPAESQRLCRVGAGSAITAMEDLARPESTRNMLVAGRQCLYPKGTFSFRKSEGAGVPVRQEDRSK